MCFSQEASGVDSQWCHQQFLCICNFKPPLLCTVPVLRKKASLASFLFFVDASLGALSVGFSSYCRSSLSSKKPSSSFFSAVCGYISELGHQILESLFFGLLTTMPSSQKSKALFLSSSSSFFCLFAFFPFSLVQV